MTKFVPYLADESGSGACSSGTQIVGRQTDRAHVPFGSMLSKKGCVTG